LKSRTRQGGEKGEKLGGGNGGLQNIKEGGCRVKTRKEEGFGKRALTPEDSIADLVRRDQRGNVKKKKHPNRAFWEYEVKQGGREKSPNAKSVVPSRIPNWGGKTGQSIPSKNNLRGSQGDTRFFLQEKRQGPKDFQGENVLHRIVGPDLSNETTGRVETGKEARTLLTKPKRPYRGGFF